jgi:CheY-like chemotaxis protein
MSTLFRNAHASPNSATHLKFGARYNVLIVDDDTTIRKTVARFLKAAGTLRSDEFIITQATNLEDAKTKILENTETDHPSFDLVITDNSMPSSGQGLALLEFVSRMTSNKPAHAFMLSGDDVKDAALARGAQGFFSKPFDIDTIKTLLNAAFGFVSTAVATPSVLAVVEERKNSGERPTVAITSTAEGIGRPRSTSLSSTGLRRAISTPDLSEAGEAFVLDRSNSGAGRAGSGTATADGRAREGTTEEGKVRQEAPMKEAV